MLEIFTVDTNLERTEAYKKDINYYYIYTKYSIVQISHYCTGDVKTYTMVDPSQEYV